MEIDLKKVGYVLIGLTLLGLVVKFIAMPISSQIKAQSEPIQNAEFTQGLSDDTSKPSK